ncbi:MAG: PTS sugar transporter subunit IIA [Candidatus Brocadiia bacterium]
MSIFFNMQRDEKGKEKVMDYIAGEYGGVGLNILEFVAENAVVCNTGPLDKASVVSLLTERIARNETKACAKTVAEAVIDREDLGSTVVEGMIAFPHARTEQVSRLHIGIATSREGFDFGREGKVRIVFLLVANDEFASVYLLALAGLARIVRNQVNLEAMMIAENSAQIRSIIGGSANFFRADLKAGELMRPPKALLDPETPLARVGYILEENHLDCAFVVSRDGTLLGEINDLDILRISAADAFLGDSGAGLILVRDAMQKGVPRVREADKAADAAMKMIDMRRTRLPVVDEHDRLLGEVVWSDIIGKMMKR